MAAVTATTASVSWWREWWQRFEGSAERLFGPGINREAFGRLTWLQLIGAASVLILTGLISEVLHWRARRKIKQEAQDQAGNPAAIAPGPSALALTLQQAHPPVRLLIWVWGIAFAGHFLLFRLPFDARILLAALSWFRRVGQIVGLFWLLYRLVAVLELELRRWGATAKGKWVDILVAVIARALRLVVLLMGFLFFIPSLDLPPTAHALVQTASSLILIGFVGFIFCQIAITVERGVITDFRVDVKDNLATRKIQTQVRILSKISVSLIGLITLALMLMVFEPVRSLGKSILASAGVAGIVLGIAAQKTLATLLAGIQIAFTQPIRLDDVVIVEGEWGRIEEITMTYVVVAIWDLRRMVLPITYFVEKPFQNWTRVSADLLGSVFLYMDYTVPIAPLRAELDRIVEGSKLWDRKVKVLQVTDATAQVIEIRILASSADSSISWDLRCLIREGMIDFIQKNYPGSLPRSRPIVDWPEARPGAGLVAGWPAERSSPLNAAAAPGAVPPAPASAAPPPAAPAPAATVAAANADKRAAVDTVSSSVGIHQATT